MEIEAEPQDKSFVCEAEPQDKSFVCEAEDLSSYTLTDLEQLLALNKTVLDHYNINLEKYKEKEAYLLEINLCKKQTELDIAHIEKEISKRKNKNDLK
jgi:hypothetical protein